MKSRVEFSYDDRGYGDLVLYDGENETIRYRARTGSINSRGILVKYIPQRGWYIVRKSVSTTEEGMTITPGMGWKVRLYTGIDDGFTNYLIHPDGGKPGSFGCIVIPKHDAIDLRNAIDERLAKGVISVITKLLSKGGV